MPKFKKKTFIIEVPVDKLPRMCYAWFLTFVREVVES